MYGFQSDAARRMAQMPAPEPKRYADGGAVPYGARGLAGLRDMIPKMQAMGYQQAAPAPAPAPVPAAPQSGASRLMAMIPAMEAMGFKQAGTQQPQYFADGGMVRGPGTGTSDSIEDEVAPGTFIMPADSTEAIGPDAMEQLSTLPVRLSDGEFKIAPEQVMALGAAVLKLLKDTTHTPVNGEDGGQTDEEVSEDAEDDGEARGFNPADRMSQMPPMMFADGGLVDNSITRVGNSYSGGNVGGNVSFNGQSGSGTVSSVPGSSNPAPAPATTPAPTAAPAVSVMAATPAPAAPATAAPVGWTERNAQRNLQVSASPIVGSPDRSIAQAALAPPPAPAPAAAGFQSAAQRLGSAPSMPQPQLGLQPRRYADGGTVEDERDKRLAQIPTSTNQPAPAPDGSQQNPLNNEVGRNVMNTLSALPGAGGMASRGGVTAARAATGGALSTERVLPAAWEVVQEGGSLASRAGTATQQMGQIGTSSGGALTRAANVAQAAPQAALPGGAGQLVPRAVGEVGEAATGFAPRARSATQWADVAQPASLAAPQAVPAAAQMSQLGTRGLGRYAAGAAGLGGAAILAGSVGDSTASPTMQAGTSPAAPAVLGAPAAGAQSVAPAVAALGQLPAGGQQGAVTRTGNSYTGQDNITGNVTINGAAPSNGGQISPQNMAAGEALGARQAQESAARVLGQMPAGSTSNVQAPFVPNSSNDWQARQDLKNAATSAASITNNGGRFDQTGGRNPAALAYQTALANDATARGAGQRLAGEAMQQTGANDRAELQQTGETQRENIRAGALTLKAQIDARKTGQAPAGYQWTSNGSLAAITGGPADPNVRGSKAPLNDVQSKALQFGTRMQTAGVTLDKLAEQGVNQPGLIKRGADVVGLGAAANWTQSGEQQQVEQSQRDFINAVLRRESGAAIADSEFANARQQYFPQPGDTPEVIALKRQNREIATSGVLAEVPDSEKRVNQVLTNAGANQPKGAADTAALPGGMTRQVGTSGGKPVYEDAQGRRFIGG